MKNREPYKEHPEQKPGERFLINLKPEDYQHIEWETKRAGKYALDFEGKIVKGLFPVFMQESEWQNFKASK